MPTERSYTARWAILYWAHAAGSFLIVCDESRLRGPRRAFGSHKSPHFRETWSRLGGSTAAAFCLGEPLTAPRAIALGKDQINVSQSGNHASHTAMFTPGDNSCRCSGLCAAELR